MRGKPQAASPVRACALVCVHKPAASHLSQRCNVFRASHGEGHCLLNLGQKDFRFQSLIQLQSSVETTNNDLLDIMTSY